MGASFVTELPSLVLLAVTFLHWTRTLFYIDKLHHIKNSEIVAHTHNDKCFFQLTAFRDRLLAHKSFPYDYDRSL